MRLAGKSTDKLDEKIKSYGSAIESHEKRIEMIRLVSQSLGKVFLSSGKTLYGGRVSDWAFIEKHKHIPFSPNKMPTYRE
jgi:hypothetical protein